jgi:hypothetical protein
VAETIELIRGISPERVIMVGGDNWNSAAGYNHLKIPVVLVILLPNFIIMSPCLSHIKDPILMEMAIRLSAEYFMESDGADQITITKLFDKVKAWSDENKIPFYLGELACFLRQILRLEPCGLNL